MICPICSTPMRLDGFKRGRQVYECPNCSRKAIAPSQRKAGRPKAPARTCSICGKPHYSKGLCQACYRSERRSHNLDKH